MIKTGQNIINMHMTSISDIAEVPAQSLYLFIWVSEEWIHNAAEPVEAHTLTQMMMEQRRMNQASGGIEGQPLPKASVFAGCCSKAHLSAESD